MLNLRAPEFRRNPYPFLRDLRREISSCQVEPLGFTAIFRHDDVVFVLKNPDKFSSAGINDAPEEKGPKLLLSTRGMLAQDRPVHTLSRKRLGKIFTQATIKNLEPVIQSVVDSLIEKMLAQHDIDFVRDFSAPLPTTVICHLLGIDPSRNKEVKRWSDTILTWRAQDPARKDEIEAIIASMYDVLVTTIEQKRRHPENDIISRLVHGDCHDEELSIEEIVTIIRLLIVAGTDTTTHLLSNTILALVDHPEIFHNVKCDHTLIPKLIEESLRFDSPVQCLMRRATDDIDFAGSHIKKNDVVLAFVASANHDEMVYRDPHLFLIDRAPQHHLTFGHGAHFCMGAQLARLQARIALRELTRNFFRLELKNNSPREYFNSIFFRGPVQVCLASPRS